MNTNYYVEARCTRNKKQSIMSSLLILGNGDSKHDTRWLGVNVKLRQSRNCPFVGSELSSCTFKPICKMFYKSIRVSMLVYNIRFLCFHDEAIKSPLEELFSRTQSSIKVQKFCIGTASLYHIIYKLLLISFTQNKLYLSEQFCTLSLFKLSMIHNICNYFLVILL